MESKVRSEATDRWEMTIEEKVDDALGQLAPSEELLLRWRFGIGDAKRKADPLPEWFPLPSRAVQRIQEDALRKLRLTAVRGRRGQRSGTR